jgi:hypothetical protein
MAASENESAFTGRVSRKMAIFARLVAPGAGKLMIAAAQSRQG